jgi:hypothetical protein
MQLPVLYGYSAFIDICDSAPDLKGEFQGRVIRDIYIPDAGLLQRTTVT